MSQKRINIFIGHFGSGKTETALNFAMKLSKEGNKMALVDLDIVNPFFRSADSEEVLERLNIKLIKPVYVHSNIDVPALPPEINAVFEDRSYTVVLDVGGDDLGAKAVSTYKQFIENEAYSMFFVINAKRPFTSTTEKMSKMLKEVEATTRLKVTHLVNNTNLLTETTVEDILESNEMVKNVAAQNGIPFGFIACMSNLSEELSSKTSESILVLDEFVKLPWDRREA